jgi:hypothetical protein
MSADPNHGQTVPAPVNVLPAQVFDLSEGCSVLPDMGKTGVPVNVLPALEFDLGSRQLASALQLTVHVRGEVPPGELALDLFRLYAAVHQLEVSYHGGGLVLDDSRCDASPTNGVVRVTFIPTEPNGAEERLAKLVDALQGAEAQYPGINRLEAQVVRNGVPRAD